MELDKVTAADFVPYLNTPFHVRLNETETLPIALTEAVEKSSTLSAPGAGRTPFALRFHGQHRGYLPQQIWQLEHETLGILEIFLVPLGPDGNRGMQYEAVFN
jgi:hypothetical protein